QTQPHPGRAGSARRGDGGPARRAPVADREEADRREPDPGDCPAGPARLAEQHALPRPRRPAVIGLISDPRRGADRMNARVCALLFCLLSPATAMEEPSSQGSVSTPKKL